MDWKRKLTSRKLWVAIASLVTAVLTANGASTGEITQVTAIIMSGATAIAYIVGEGLIDSKNVGAGDENV